MLLFVAALGEGILIADDKGAAGTGGVIGEGAVGEEGVKEEDAARLHRHGHGTLDFGSAMGEGEFAMAGVVADHVGGFQSLLLTAGRDPNAAVLLIAILQGNPRRHAAIALRVLRVVGVVLMPMADLLIVRSFLKQLGRIDRDAGFNEIFDECENPFVATHLTGEFGFHTELEDDVSLIGVVGGFFRAQAFDFAGDTVEFCLRKHIVNENETVAMIGGKLVGGEFGNHRGDRHEKKEVGLFFAVEVVGFGAAEEFNLRTYAPLFAIRIVKHIFCGIICDDEILEFMFRRGESLMR